MKLGDLKFLSLNCRQASRLLSEAEDRNLSSMERFGLKLHVATCKSCRKFREQLVIMRQSLKTLDTQLYSSSDPQSAPQLSDDARERIRQKLASEKD